MTDWGTDPPLPICSGAVIGTGSTTLVSLKVFVSLNYARGFADPAGGGGGGGEPLHINSTKPTKSHRRHSQSTIGFLGGPEPTFGSFGETHVGAFLTS